MTSTKSAEPQTLRRARAKSDRSCITSASPTAGCISVVAVAFELARCDRAALITTRPRLLESRPFGEHARARVRRRRANLSAAPLSRTLQAPCDRRSRPARPGAGPLPRPRRARDAAQGRGRARRAELVGARPVLPARALGAVPRHVVRRAARRHHPLFRVREIVAALRAGGARATSRGAPRAAPRAALSPSSAVSLSRARARGVFPLTSRAAPRRAPRARRSSRIGSGR